MPLVLSTSVPPAPLPNASTGDSEWGPSLSTSVYCVRMADQKYWRIKISQEQHLTIELTNGSWRTNTPAPCS